MLKLLIAIDLVLVEKVTRVKAKHVRAVSDFLAERFKPKPFKTPQSGVKTHLISFDPRIPL